ncbi:hypothetical protein BDY19DRAFT_910578 [Irpex rosettiformis]|uniref:Uncharacterized protein n=1 Tax=Irpex rosettiformis TaxID=378272 RepID=A0ACB8TNE7_9APHY|nr:hypothetical protein BDY19DRAFT_910578 [Irpex rosettiformis]
MFQDKTCQERQWFSGVAELHSSSRLGASTPILIRYNPVPFLIAKLAGSPTDSRSTLSPSGHSPRTAGNNQRAGEIGKPSVTANNNNNMTTSTSRRYVPPEIVGQILDSITHPQTRALIACSLVCRQWYSLVRPQLFSTLVVRLNKDRKSIRRFAEFLGANQETSRLIRHLILYTYSGLPISVIPTISSGSLAMVLSHLTSLESLSLENLGISYDGISTTHTCSLQSLSLEGLSCGRMPHYGDLTDILSLFHSLGSLRIHSLNLTNTTHAHSSESDNETEEWYTTDLITSRLRTPLPSLKVQRLTIDRQERASAFLQLVRFTGSVVQILWLDAPLWEINTGVHLDTSVAMFSQALSRCTSNLTTFVLYQWMDYSNSPTVPCRRIISIINSLPTTLSHLRIDLDDEINDGWDLFDDATWEALRTAVRRMSNLRTLELSADGIEGDGQMGEDCRTMVRHEMQEFDVSGILRLPELVDTD